MNIDSINQLRSMRAQTVHAACGTYPEARAALGVPAVDEWFGRGLKYDALHEIYAAQLEDGVSATGFALLLAELKRKTDTKKLIWIRMARSVGHDALPYGPGLCDLGIDPAAIIFLPLPDTKSVLCAGLDCARDGASAVVLIELEGKQPLVDLTASRRLALAAAKTGTMILLVRVAAEPVASAAQTRWQVTCAPSRQLDASAPGYPAFGLSLLRHRGGLDGLNIVLEWDRDTAYFREHGAQIAAPPLSGVVPAMAVGRAGDTSRAA
jgi:protein ImuA